MYNTLSQEYTWIRLKHGRDQRVRSGHLWIFSNEIADGFQSCAPGALVHVEDDKGKPVGTGTCNPHSLITVRLYSRDIRPIDDLFFEKRLRAAVNLRESLFGAEEAACCRMVYSESDGLPGLIVDRFDDVLVVQSNTAGMDNLLQIIVPILKDLLKPHAIVLAQDAPIRRLEGLNYARGVVYGQLDGPLRFEKDGILFLADLLGGQKTGFYFDQTWNRRLAASFVRPGFRVLDLFCYTGAFGLYALKAGAKRVSFVDASEAALNLARRNAELNGWLDRAEFIMADVFEWLRGLQETYDLVVLDPPALAKSRSKVPDAIRAYRDLNARAMKGLSRASILVTASCSGLVQVDSWRSSLRDAARKAHRQFRILASGTQAPDHPVLASMPETEYLKCIIARVD